ncbi:MAG: hypothetical protein GY810_22000, partial [Aureispira sp.]|nr:hypothetical protein [Aureispira sp.]
MGVFGKTGQVIGDFIHFVIDGQKVRFPKSMSDTQIEQAINNKVRLKRAEEQGFDTSQTYYHGTRREFNEFEPMQPRGALGNEKGVYFTKDKRTAEEYAMDVDGATDEKSRIVEAYLKKPKEVGNSYTGKEYLVTDPKNIRSTNAQFKDPDSKNLLASAAGLGVLKGADYAYSQDEGQDTQAGVITKGGKKLIEAWHGTPHSFDKF